jgi:hypothetical protein
MNEEKYINRIINCWFIMGLISAVLIECANMLNNNPFGIGIIVYFLSCIIIIM